MPPILEVGLPSSGIVCTFPRALWWTIPSNIKASVFPIFTTGKGFRTSKGFSNTATLTTTSTGKVVRTTLEQLTLEIGCGSTLSLPLRLLRGISERMGTSPYYLLSTANISCCYHCSARREFEATNSTDSICAVSSLTTLRSQISRQAAAPRSPRLHGTGNVPQPPATNGLRRDHQVFKSGYCGEQP
jgi:hypothetical protein